MGSIGGGAVYIDCIALTLLCTGRLDVRGGYGAGHTASVGMLVAGLKFGSNSGHFSQLARFRDLARFFGAIGSTVVDKVGLV